MKITRQDATKPPWKALGTTWGQLPYSVADALIDAGRTARVREFMYRADDLLVGKVPLPLIPKVLGRHKKDRNETVLFLADEYGYRSSRRVLRMSPGPECEACIAPKDIGIVVGFAADTRALRAELRKRHVPDDHI